MSGDCMLFWSWSCVHTYFKKCHIYTHTYLIGCINQLNINIQRTLRSAGADKNLILCTGNFSLFVCRVLSAPGDTDVLLLTALLSVQPLWWTVVQQTCVALTIQLVLRQSLKDPIVRALSNYGNLINLFSSSPPTAFVLAWDLLRDLCEQHLIEGVRDRDGGAALFCWNLIYFQTDPENKIRPVMEHEGRVMLDFLSVNSTFICPNLSGAVRVANADCVKLE